MVGGVCPGGDAVVSYNPQYITGEPQFRQPPPSEKEKITNNITFAMIFFFIAAIVFIILGTYYMATYAHLNTLDDKDKKDFLGPDYRNATSGDLQLAILAYLAGGVVLLIWGIIGLVFAFVTRTKALMPLARGEFEEAGRYLNILTVMGFIFGIVIAGVLLFKARDLLKKTAVRMSPTNVNVTPSSTGSGTSGEVHRCQVCNSMMTFNPQTRMWFCSSCNRYQM